MKIASFRGPQRGWFRSTVQFQNGKNKKTWHENNGECDRRGERSSSFILKNARILVQLQLQLTSLRKRVVSLESWILQIMVWVIITWEPSNMVPTVFGDTGPHLWHTCPTRHVKVHSSRDTCESTCAAKRHNEFERQPTFWDVLESPVRTHYIRPLRMQRTSECSKHHIVFWRSETRHFSCRSPSRNAR